jgi:pilus assembly protein Flp/PilA
MRPRQSQNHSKGKERMLRNFLKRLWQEEEGQDLVEYGLLVALVALAATAGMKSLASSINTAFTTLGTTLSGYTS